MPRVTYIESDGTVHEVHIEKGHSVMQGALYNMITGIVAECGGCCSCATCHCYVDDAWSEIVDDACESEREILQYAVNLKPASRLSCQIIMTDDLDGLIVHLPESQY